MGGFLGIGGSSANTDRGNQLAATQGEWNIFNYGLPTGQAQQSTGTGVLNTATQSAGQAQDYYSKLLTAGRTDTATRSAPAINAQLAGADAQRTQNSQFGTGRSGGTASANANAGAATTAAVDNTINTNLVSGQWLPLKTNTLGAGVNTLLPWPPTNGAAAFYRVVWLP